jgi:hypothetical protein
MRTIVTTFVFVMLLGASASAQTILDGALSSCIGPGFDPEVTEQGFEAFLDELYWMPTKQCQKTCKAYEKTISGVIKAQDSCLNTYIKGTIKVAAEVCVGKGGQKKLCKSAGKALESDALNGAKVHTYFAYTTSRIYENACYSMCY